MLRPPSHTNDQLWPDGPQPPVRTLKLLDNVRLNGSVGNGWVGPLFLVGGTNGHHDLGVSTNETNMFSSSTHGIPEPEATLHLLRWGLDASERLINKLQSRALRLVNSIGIRVLRSDSVAKVECRGVKIRLRKNSEASVDVALERKAWG